MIPRRFPRILVPDRLKARLRILRLTYNLLMKRKRRYLWHYDVFTTPKLAGRNLIAFVDLAAILREGNIDPSLYLKIMCRYGRFKDAPYLPSPVWLSKRPTVEKFRWIYRRQRRSYGLHLQFKKEISGWSDLDIYASIRDSSNMFRDATEKLGLAPDEATVLLRKDLSPWYLAVSLLRAPDRKDFIQCLDLLRRDKQLQRLAFKAFDRR